MDIEFIMHVFSALLWWLDTFVNSTRTLTIPLSYGQHHVNKRMQTPLLYRTIVVFGAIAYFLFVVFLLFFNRGLL